MIIVSPTPVCLAHPKMMSSLPLLLRERPFRSTSEQVELQWKISQTSSGSREVFICNYGFSFGRVDYPSVVRTRRSSPGGKVNGFVKLTLCYDLHSTGSVNEAPQNLMNWSPTCSNLWVMMLPLCHMNDIWIVRCYLFRHISGIKAQKVLPRSADSPIHCRQDQLLNMWIS